MVPRGPELRSLLRRLVGLQLFVAILVLVLATLLATGRPDVPAWLAWCAGLGGAGFAGLAILGLIGLRRAARALALPPRLGRLLALTAALDAAVALLALAAVAIALAIGPASGWDRLWQGLATSRTVGPLVLPLAVLVAAAWGAGLARKAGQLVSTAQAGAGTP